MSADQLTVTAYFKFLSNIHEAPDIILLKGRMLMFYQMKNDTLETVLFENVDPNVETAGFVTLAEFEEIFPKLNFTQNCLEECQSGRPYFSSKIEVYDDFDYCYIDLMDTDLLTRSQDRIALFMKKNFFLCVELSDADKHMEKHFLNITAQEMKHITLEKIVYEIMLGFIGNAGSSLSRTENRILKLEERLFDGGETGDLNKAAFQIKRLLFDCQTYFEELQDIGMALTENANHIFHQGNLRYLTIFTDKSARICHDIDQMLERLVHLQDSYCAMLDLSLNGIMKIFTVITAIFLPLTLLVGWYGMNFTTMPELTWKFGYLYVIVVSIMVAVICLLLFKKKKWM